jgi:hypothetical protein
VAQGIVGDTKPGIIIVRLLVGVQATGWGGDFYVHLHSALRLDGDGLFFSAAEYGCQINILYVSVGMSPI